MQGAVWEVRGRLETIAREARHRDFSPARLIAAVLQALVIGFFVAALADWVYGAKEGLILAQLAFAAVLQLAARTGFVWAQS